MGSRVFLDPIRPPSVTTAQRDALAGVGNGDIIYNSSIGAMQQRAGGLWVPQEDPSAWLQDSNQWKYGAATAFGVNADASGYLARGTKLSYNDGAVDYALVDSVTVTASTPITGVTTDVVADTFNKTAHGLQNFSAVVVNGLVNTTGVANGEVYFVVNATANTFQLAPSLAGGAGLTGSNDTNVTITAGTLVGVMANSNYSIANATLTATRYSNAATPAGWPASFMTPAGGTRETTITSSATWAPNADTTDIFTVTAQAAAATTISNPAGTPYTGQLLVIRIKDNGSPRALTWSGTKWRAPAQKPLPLTTIPGVTMSLVFRYNGTDDKWDYQPPGPSQLPYRTGNTFGYQSPFGGSGALTLVQDTLYAQPYYVRYPTSFSKLRVVSTSAIASSLARLGAYTDNGGVPDAMITDAGTVSCATTGDKDLSIAVTLLDEGWVWLAVAMQGAAGALKCTLADQSPGLVPSTNMFSNGPISGYTRTGVSGALPSSWGATKTEAARVPIISIFPT